MKKGVLLVNLGTPDSTSVPDVRKYLREFLLDKRVIDIPTIPRNLLVNGIIAPFRAPKSAAEYRKLWTEQGSPLKVYSESMVALLQNMLGEEYVVALGMRYQSPSIASGLEKLIEQDVESILVVSLFPQYASATTGSVVDKVMEIAKNWQIIPNISFVNKFFDHPLFIQTIVERAKEQMTSDHYDHYVFSYHGLPERQIIKGSVKEYCKLGTCCNTYEKRNQYCYRAQCFQTSYLIADALELKPEQYTICFQSRLGKTPWIQPYTEDVVIDLAKKGKKKVLAFSPAFVADCLETTIEIGETYKEDFEHHGGEKWQLVESLNEHPLWIECLKQLVEENQ